MRNPALKDTSCKIWSLVVLALTVTGVTLLAADDPVPATPVAPVGPVAPVDPLLPLGPVAPTAPCETTLAAKLLDVASGPNTILGQPAVPEQVIELSEDWPFTVVPDTTQVTVTPVAGMTDANPVLAVQPVGNVTARFEVASKFV